MVWDGAYRGKISRAYAMLPVVEGGLDSASPSLTESVDDSGCASGNTSSHGFVWSAYVAQGWFLNDFYRFPGLALS